MAMYRIPLDRTATYRAGSRDVSQTGSQFDCIVHKEYPSEVLAEDLDDSTSSSTSEASQLTANNEVGSCTLADRSDKIKGKEPWHNIAAIKVKSLFKTAAGKA
jgi:hypothetical protein